jgi:uncharacterized membrane protein YcjF (UPF0283 family)
MWHSPWRAIQTVLVSVPATCSLKTKKAPKITSGLLDALANVLATQLHRPLHWEQKRKTNSSW